MRSFGLCSISGCYSLASFGYLSFNRHSKTPRGENPHTSTSTTPGLNQNVSPCLQALIKQLLKALRKWCTRRMVPVYGGCGEHHPRPAAGTPSLTSPQSDGAAPGRAARLRGGLYRRGTVSSAAARGPSSSAGTWSPGAPRLSWPVDRPATAQ